MQTTRKNKYRSFYNKRTYDNEATSLYEAQKDAARHFGVKQTWKVSTLLLELADGTPVVHTPVD